MSKSKLTEFCQFFFFFFFVSKKSYAQYACYICAKFLIDCLKALEGVDYTHLLTYKPKLKIDKVENAVIL